MNFLQCTLIDFLFLPSVTSPKEVKASFKDFSSTDQDKPARHVSIITTTIIKATYAQETKREKEGDLQQRVYCLWEEKVSMVNNSTANSKLGFGLLLMLL